MTDKQANLRDWAIQIDSPPLQGRGRGWGVSAGQLDQLASRAGAMRRNPTEPEVRLWNILSRSQLGGHKFRRQAVIGDAIADFLCPRKGLVLEIDGDTHVDQATDARRTEKLEALGYQVIRFANEDVMRNLEGVAARLCAVLDALPDRRAPHPNPSPEGEGLLEICSKGTEF
ncbi:MAG: endonuclease domain-containing protein [Sphingobium sp.]|nr:endonuclease domain-containing protein [Sphingobium sp.]